MTMTSFEMNNHDQATNHRAKIFHMLHPVKLESDLGMRIFRRAETGTIMIPMANIAKVISIDRKTRGYLREQNKHNSRSVIDAFVFRSLLS